MRLNPVQDFMRTTCLVILFYLTTPLASYGADEPFPGKRGMFHGFLSYDFKLDGISCRVVTPKKVAPGKPWIWRARFWGHEPQTDLALLKLGWHVGYCDVANLFGSPKAIKRWNTFYDHLTGIDMEKMENIVVTLDFYGKWLQNCRLSFLMMKNRDFLDGWMTS